MNKIVKQIEELKNDISYIEFQDHLSSSDYMRISKLRDQIRELEKQIKGLKGIVVHVTYKDTKHFGTDGWYLSNDASLCCSSEPVLFESLEEAKRQLKESNINLDRYNVEFIETTL